MKIFIDSIDLDEITKFVEIGLVDGVTTNPSSVSKGSLSYKMILHGICEIVSGPVSAEVLSEDFDSMMIEAEQLLEVAQNLVVKLPATYNGLKVAKQLNEKKQKTNITLCFTAHQALLAAKVGATYVSPFVGRLEDQAEDGIGLLADIMSIYREYDMPTQVIAASIRNPFHVLEAARRGVDVVTLPPNVLEAMLHHNLTISGLKKFAEDWSKSGKGSI